MPINPKARLAMKREKLKRQVKYLQECLAAVQEELEMTEEIISRKGLYPSHNRGPKHNAQV